MCKEKEKLSEKISDQVETIYQQFLDTYVDALNEELDAAYVAAPIDDTVAYRNPKYPGGSGECIYDLDTDEIMSNVSKLAALYNEYTRYELESWEVSKTRSQKNALSKMLTYFDKINDRDKTPWSTHDLNLFNMFRYNFVM